uniref:Uncharacterized protein n=1 Tax=Romanomermis culicivorax TaxID=13658 RepID=A0A915JWM6_ROMCU
MPRKGFNISQYLKEKTLPLFAVTKEDAQKLLDEQKLACKKSPGSWTDFTWHDAKILPNNAPAVIGQDGIQYNET